MGIKSGRKNEIYAPFGVAVKRFATIGYHPGLDPSGSLQKKGGVGPGQYEINFRDCWYKTHFTEDTWTRKRDTELFSEMLGFRNPQKLKERRDALKAFYAKVSNGLKANGPGTLDIPNELFKRKSNNVKENIFFGAEKRFYNPIKNTNPSPGTYGKEHIPSKRFEETCKPIHQWTVTPSFEWDNFINRFKIGRYEAKNTLPPNRYKNIHQVGIEQTIAKKGSKRGPYDCFTGPRDGTTIKGYFAPCAFKGAKNWPIKLPGEIGRFRRREFVNYGKFLKCDRFTKNPGIRLILNDLTMCPKNPEDPGPGHYDVEKKKEVKQNLAAFNQSVIHVRGATKWKIHPGVGRYNAEVPKCKHKQNRETWMFKSKSKREFYHIETYNSF